MTPLGHRDSTASFRREGFLSRRRGIHLPGSARRAAARGSRPRVPGRAGAEDAPLHDRLIAYRADPASLDPLAAPGCSSTRRGRWEASWRVCSESRGSGASRARRSAPRPCSSGSGGTSFNAAPSGEAAGGPRRRRRRPPPRSGGIIEAQLHPELTWKRGSGARDGENWRPGSSISKATSSPRSARRRSRRFPTPPGREPGRGTWRASAVEGPPSRSPGRRGIPTRRFSRSSRPCSPHTRSGHTFGCAAKTGVDNPRLDLLPPAGAHELRRPRGDGAAQPRTPGGARRALRPAGAAATDSS